MIRNVGDGCRGRVHAIPGDGVFTFTRPATFVEVVLRGVVAESGGRRNYVDPEAGGGDRLRPFGTQFAVSHRFHREKAVLASAFRRIGERLFGGGTEFEYFAYGLHSIVNE